MEDIGKIKIGVFNCMSYNGYKFDVLKSGLNKYVRRGDVLKGMYCISEILLFRKINDDKKLKGIMSNMRNRLIIILNEDIGISNWKLYKIIYDMINEWEKTNNDILLLKVMELMCNEKKLRLCSWIRGYYKNCYNSIEFKNKYNVYNDIEFEKYKIGYGKKYYVKNDDEELKKYIDGFCENVDCNNDKLFYWFFKILDFKGKVGSRNRRRKSGCVILSIMKNKIIECKNKDLIDLYNVVEDWYWNRNNSRNENWLYICNLVLFYIKRDVLDWERKIIEFKDDEYYKNILNENLKNKDMIRNDHFLIDMHVEKGRIEGKNEKDFVNVGSIVIDEDKRFINELYKKSYEDLKLLNVDNKEKKKDKKGKRKIKLKIIKKKNVKKLRKINEVLEEGILVDEEDDNKKININKVKKIRKKKKKIDFSLEEKLEFVEFEKLFDIKDVNDLNEMLCEKNVCGNKAMCFKKNNLVFKEVKKSFNYGRDCLVLDEIKSFFGFKNIGMKRVLSNKVVRRIDLGKKEWENNMKIEENKNVVYLIMNEFKNKGSLSKNKKLYKDENIKREVLKIGMFRGIFRVSDFNYRNILVNDVNEICSIDENNIGNRKDIFWKGFNWKDFDKKIVDEVLDEIINDNENKKLEIKKCMEKYLFDIELINEVMNNFDNIKSKVYEEFGY